MKYDLIITKQALDDSMDSYNYYENILMGLGNKFLESLENRYAALSQHPEFYNYSDENQIFRDVAIDGFLYLIIYEVSADNVIVYAIHNTYKNSTV